MKQERVWGPSTNICPVALLGEYGPVGPLGVRRPVGPLGVRRLWDL